MTNAVSMPRECFPKSLEFLKKIVLAPREFSLKREILNGAEREKN